MRRWIVYHKIHDTLVLQIPALVLATLVGLALMIAFAYYGRIGVPNRS